jgi:ABC-type nickel/cobalt efflux system permease component RcnA
MNLLPPPEQREQRRAARRERTRTSALRQIYLPMAAGLFVLAALAVLLFLLPGQAADSVVLTVLLLCPMSVGLFVVYIAVVMLVIGLAQGHRYGAMGLDTLNDFADQVRSFTRKSAGVINESSIKFNSAVTPVTHVMKSVYEPDASDSAPGNHKTDGRK